MGSDDMEMVLVNPDSTETILSRDQASYVKFESESTSLIMKGVAGSGKSLVLMSKVLRLIKSQPDGSKNYILLVSYTNSLVKYAKEYLDPDESKKDSICICTLNSFIQEISKSMMRFYDYPRGTPVEDEDRTRLIDLILNKNDNGSTHRFYKTKNRKDTISFLSEEFEWLLSRGIYITDLDNYLKDPRRGRKSHMNEVDRREAFGIYKAYLDLLVKNHFYEWGMMHLFVLRHIDSIPERFKFRYVLVDEAQDFPIVDMKIVRALSKEPVTIAMDANQRIYSHYWTFKEIGIIPYSRGLKKSFRCTKQIDQLADVLRQNNKSLESDEICEHVEPEREGSLPLVIETKNYEDQENILINLLKEFQKMGNTAIIVQYRYEVRRWAQKISELGIHFDMIMGSDYGHKYCTRSSGIKICTIHSAKGLEFDNVIIPTFNDGRYPRQMPKSIGEPEPDSKSINEWIDSNRNLAYVAMTRAKNRLVILYYGKPSMFLSEIDEASSGRPNIGESNELYMLTTSDCIESDQNLTMQDDDLTEYVEKTRVEPMIYVRPAGILNEGYTPEQLQRKYTDRMSILKSAQGINHRITEESELMDDPKRNLDLLVELAKEGFPGAQYNLALFFIQGIGTKKSENKALNWLFEAESNGSTEARDILATYDFEWKSPNLEILRRAAELGNKSARSILSDKLSTMTNESVAFRLKEQLYHSGDIEALYHMGWYSEMGKGGVARQDFGFAKYCYRVYYEHTNNIRGKRGLERLMNYTESQTLPKLKPLGSEFENLFIQNTDEYNNDSTIDETGSMNGDEPEESDIVLFLQHNGIEFKDNRCDGKNLWVKGGTALESNLSKITALGFEIKNKSSNDIKTSKWFKLESL